MKKNSLDLSKIHLTESSINGHSLTVDFYGCMSLIVDEMNDVNANTYNDSMKLIRGCAIEKNIEFDGYFLERWLDSADTIINFDEEYFQDPDKRDLYVFLSAMVDDEIFEFLRIAFQLFEPEALTKEILEQKIHVLTKVKGVRF